MVNYSNPELFYEHESVHWVIVNASATVTGVSEDEPTITDADFVITEEDIELEKMTIDESICSLDNLTFGQCEASRIQFTMYTKQGVPSLEDAEIAVYLYFNGDSSTLFQVGVYVIEKDNLSVNRDTRDISGYDIMYYLRDYDITDWYNEIYETDSTVTVKDLRDSLFAWLAQDIDDFSITQEITTLDNDDFAIEKSIESDTITFAFFMQRLLEINGVFGHINRQGIFTYVKLDLYDNNPVMTIEDELLIPPVKYQDWNTWGIGYVIVYDRNNNKLAKIGDSAYRHPSNYTVVDSFVFYNNLKRSGWQEEFETAVSNMREAITHRRYRSCEINCIGSLCLEVGDRIDVQWNEYDDDDNITVKQFKTYILERRFTGIQGFDDTYIAKGDKKQPKYQVNNDNWHTGDNQINSLDGVEQLASQTSSDDFVETIRNIGFRLLDEPSNVSVEYEDEPTPPTPREDIWVAKTWYGLTNPTSSYIWSDGTDIYYSRGTQHYILNRETDTWVSKTWNGLTNFDGSYIWTDGTDIYYSASRGEQYVLDKSTSTWNTKTWGTNIPMSGGNVWTDGTNVYYSNGQYQQYVLDKSTSTWNTKTWNGFSNLIGVYIWTDGENIYYSNNGENRVLDLATSTWSNKTWNGYTNISGEKIWSDRDNIYYSSYSAYQYVLDKTTSTWSVKTWGGFSNFPGTFIWKDGDNVYCSNDTNQFVLT